MRFELILSPKELRFSVPINYNYLLYSALLNILHSSQLRLPNFVGDSFKSNHILHVNKLFSFSKLLCPNSKVTQTSYSGFGDLKLLLSFPLEDDFAPIITNVFKSKGVIKLLQNDSNAEFKIKSIRQLPEPEFSYEQKFVMLAPTAVSKIMFHNGYKILHFYRVHETETEGAIAYNLRKKYELLYNAKFSGTIEVKFDQKYIRTKGGSEGVSKLITIREGRSDEFKIKGFIAPITIKSDPEILRIAYQCGIGEFNCLGLGMLEIVSTEKKQSQFEQNKNNIFIKEREFSSMECIPT